ncbi:peptidase family S66 [Halenospora varia]|nr:peptidase family S66 [Halenospora varia]
MALELIPRALKKGDTIAFISPSERPNEHFPAAITRAKTYLESRGYHIKTIFTSPLSTNYKTSLLQRAAEIHQAFSDPKVNAILCTIGGTSASSLLPYLDFNLIKSYPKIFCGYSDITVLHYAFSKSCGLRTFYSPAALSEFGDWPKPDPFSFNHWLKMLEGHGTGPIPQSDKWTSEMGMFVWGKEKDETVRPNMKPNAGWKWLRKGKVEGPIVGGCISVILRLAGTKFWPSYTGKILLLETSMGEGFPEAKPAPLSRIRSWMADLVNLGVFGLDGVSGLVFGRPWGWDAKGMEEFRNMVREVVDAAVGEESEREFPVLMDVDVGHTSPMVTIPLGAKVRLDEGKDEFVILEEGVVV